MVLHAIYVVLQLYGWHAWSSGRQAARPPLPVTRLGLRGALPWAAATLGVAAGWGELMQRFTDAAAPHADAVIAAASLSGQSLLARKKLANWWFWLAVDVVAVVV